MLVFFTKLLLSGATVMGYKAFLPRTEKYRQSFVAIRAKLYQVPGRW